MQPTKKNARLIGSLYVMMGAAGAFNLVYVPNKVIVSGNAAATAANILGHEFLFRLGIVAGLASTVGFLLLARALAEFFDGVSKPLGRLMTNFVAISVALGFIAEAMQIAALNVLRSGADFLNVFSKPQREAFGYLFIRLHSQIILVNEIFWGLWLIPLGILVIRSGFIPKLIGILLIVNSAPYIAASLSAVLDPAHAISVFNPFVMIFTLGEVWMMLWLLIFGVRHEGDRLFGVRTSAGSAAA